MKKRTDQAFISPAEGKPTKPAPEPAGSQARGDVVGDSTPPGRGPLKTTAMPEARNLNSDRVKPPVPQNPPEEVRITMTTEDRGDQQPRSETQSQSPGAGERYIRMRIRVRDDQLSVLDSHLVDGPLGQASSFPGTNAYEVSLDNRLLHAGQLPDLGVQRSFVNPDPNAPPEQKGHHITERPIYEFMARVPAAEVTADTIRRITITLHRVKEEARSPELGSRPLGRQFEREIRPVAQLVGLPESVLPDAIETRGAQTPSL